MRLKSVVLSTTFVIVSLASVFGDGAPTTLRPGALGGGVTLLPNGWKIAPAGIHRQIGDLPLAMVESPDGRWLLVSNNGYEKPTIGVFDLKNQYLIDAVVLDHAWLGLAWHPDGKRLYVSGAGNNTVHEMYFAAGKLTRGIDFVLGQIVSAIDLKTGHVLHSIELPAEPYTCIVSPDGATLFVSLWGGAKLLLFDARTLEPRGEIAVGEHPNAMTITKDGKRIFVACANTNAVWVIDVEGRHAVEQIATALFPNAPPGSTPNSVSLSPDDKRLLVANADNNTVAVVDVSKAGASQVEGFIPTGWYP